jgi:hypothetical protein
MRTVLYGPYQGPHSAFLILSPSKDALSVMQPTRERSFGLKPMHFLLDKSGDMW